MHTRSTTYPMGTDPSIEVIEESDYDIQWSLDAPWYRVVTTGQTTTTLEGGLVAHTKTVSYEDFEEGHAKTIVETTEGGFQQVTARTFDNDHANWRYGQVADERITSITPAPELESQTQATLYSYDPVTGQLQDIVRQHGTWGDSDTTLNTQYAYDPGGLLTSVTLTDTVSSPPRVETYGYSPDGVYVIQIINAENHHHHWGFDPAHDGVVIAADENGAITESFYDGLGRPTSMKGPDGSSMTTTYVSSSPMGIERTISGGGWQAVHVDAFERPIQLEAMLGVDATKTMVQTRYDAAGRVMKRSVPVEAGTNVGDGWESYEYDGMGRPTRVVRPGPAPSADTTWSYPNLHTVVETDEVGHQITRVFSPDRLPASASVQVGSVTEVTTFDYAPFGNVDRIVDPAGNVTSMKYDALGRRTFLGDPNTGDVHEAYNAFGELREQVNALGSTRTFTHDRLGRVLTRNTEDGTDTYVYDVGLGNIGRPHMAHSADGVTIAYHHDALGRPTSRTYTYGGEQFTVGYGYDPFGRPSTTTYPITAGGFQLTTQRHYNPTTGELASITDGSTTLWAVDDRDIAGRVSRASLGAEVEVESTYLPYEQKLKSRVVTDDVLGITVTRLNLNFSYYLNGQIETRNAGGVSETFTYDERGRVNTWARTHAGATRTWDYNFDLAGNLDDVWQTGAGLPPKLEDLVYPQPATPRPHAATASGPYTYSYDDAGRMETRHDQGVLDRTFDYNSHDLPKAGWSNGVTFTVAYDAHGQRFRKDAAVETTYIAGIYERRRDGTAESHRHLVPLEGGAMAIVTLRPTQAVETRYLVTDDTGTPHIVLRADGTTDEQLYYEPYGARLQADGTPLSTAPAEMSFGMTGHEYDDEIGLINMGGRLYDPELRRFLTPDPFVSGPFDARGLDRYGYVDGDPANRMDPTGFQAEDTNAAGDLSNFCLGTGCGVATGDSPGAGTNPGAQNLDASTGIAAGGENADQHAGQGDVGGRYIDDGFSHVLRGLETAQNVALGVAGTALAIAAIVPAVEAATVWAASNMGAAGVGASGAAAAARRYGTAALKVGKGLLRSGSRMASRAASRVGSKVSGWARSWSGTVQRLAGDDVGSLGRRGAARGTTVARELAKRIPSAFKCRGECFGFADKLQAGLRSSKIQGTRIDIEVGKGVTVYSDSLGALGSRGVGHSAIRVGDMVFDNMRPSGVPYQQFIADLGGDAFFSSGFARMVTTTF